MKKHERRSRPKLKLLKSGQKLAQPAFNKRYSLHPDHLKFELVGGTVHEPPPTSHDHALDDLTIASMLMFYSMHTPGTEAGSAASVIMSPIDQPEPDSYLRILPEFGGQSSVSKKLLKGSPELLVEIAYSTQKYDLGLKKQRYKKFGVTEYIVFCLEPRQLHWFLLAEDAEVIGDTHGIFRSRCFPGLTIDSNALINSDRKILFDKLMIGLSSTEHQDFCARLLSASSD